MARVLSVDGLAPRPLAGDWDLVTTPPGACAEPGDLGGYDDWIPAPVPGTAAAALRAAGRWSDAAPTPIHDRDVWYRLRQTPRALPLPLAGRGRGGGRPADGFVVPSAPPPPPTPSPQGGGERTRLRFEGLATLAEVWLDGVPVLVGRSMFEAYEVEVDLTEASELLLCFRSLAAELARPHKRGRWRPRLATPGSLRGARTSLIGFMPGWCPPVDLVGPYRPITCEPAARRVSADLRADFDGADGRLLAVLAFDGASGPARLVCDGREAVLVETAPGRYEGVLDLPGVAPWFPHTHGEPRLHAVEARVGGHRLDLGRVGFRQITLTRPFEEGLSLAVNGVPVFCRGAAWTPPDLVGLSGAPETYRPLLEQAREAGMNMLRVGGTMLVEAEAFHDLCDELGILVWQDLMLANFDYPTDDPAFRDGLVREVEGFLDRRQTSPSLCVLCGGSEVQQQAAMLGAPPSVWAAGFVADELPGLAHRLRPDLVVVPNSPCGGDLPFSPTAGVTHYYGVGAYRRPLEDARRAEVGFATECLAFANVPDAAHLARAGLVDPAAPAWAAAIPRDRGADWDFEGVRDHYLAALFGADPDRLRAEDPERYLALARATSVEVMEATFAEWRRARSPTTGGLVWFLRDLAPGAGWGVIDSDGRPKPAWYGLKRAFRPVQLTLSDEGLSGLHLHVHNERPTALEARVSLAFHAADGRRVLGAERAVAVDARGSATLSSATLLGRFFDATDAYRFGPAVHSLAHARLTDAEGGVLADAFHFPAGRDAAPAPIGLEAALEPAGEGWALTVTSARHALGVEIETAAHPSDNWFHLAPGAPRRVALTGRERPRGTVRALNAVETVEF